MLEDTNYCFYFKSISKFLPPFTVSYIVGLDGMFFLISPFCTRRSLQYRVASNVFRGNFLFIDLNASLLDIGGNLHLLKT